MSLQAGNIGGIDTIAVRAFNGSYWGDWRKFTVDIVTQGPVVSAQTASQTWQEGQPVNFTLAANTFTDPQNEALTYKASSFQRGGIAVLAAVRRRDPDFYRHGSEQCRGLEHPGVGDQYQRAHRLGNVRGPDTGAGAADGDQSDCDAMLRGLAK